MTEKPLDIDKTLQMSLDGTERKGRNDKQGLASEAKWRERERKKF